MAQRDDARRFATEAAPASAVDLNLLVSLTQKGAAAEEQIAGLLRSGLTALVNEPTSLFDAARTATLDLVNDWVSRQSLRLVASYGGGDVAEFLERELRRAVGRFKDEFGTRAPPEIVLSLERIEVGVTKLLHNSALTQPIAWLNIGEGHRSFDSLLENFEPIIRHFAAKFSKPDSLQREESRQECRLALHSAAKEYSSNKGYSFSTYAKAAMRNALTSASRKQGGRTEHLARLQDGFQLAEDKLAHTLKRSPYPEEVFEELGWGSEKIENFKRAIAVVPSGDQEESIDFVVDPQTTAIDNMIADEASAAAQTSLEDLDPISQQVLRLRILLGLPLQKAADELGVARQTFRQLEAEAEAKFVEQYSANSRNAKTTPTSDRSQ